VVITQIIADQRMDCSQNIDISIVSVATETSLNNPITQQWYAGSAV